jgi:AcrR family transcriptional regulator
MDGDTPKRRGRRGGGEDTRAALLAAARDVFAEQGYSGATVRGIAGRAGVDPAMVNHWFGSKQGLFSAIVDVPFDPAELISRATDGPPEDIASRVIHAFITLWDTHEGRFAALMLSVASQEAAAAAMASFFTGTVFRVINEVTGADRAGLRASLAASQMLGLGVARYVLRLEPLASADVDTIVSLVGPNLQRYLTGEL